MAVVLLVFFLLSIFSVFRCTHKVRVSAYMDKRCMLEKTTLIRRLSHDKLAKLLYRNVALIL